MKRLWPFDDYQPVGAVDLVFTTLFASMIVWPPFFGVLQVACCVRRFSHPGDPRLIVGLIALLVMTGALLGFLCGMAVVLGGHYRIAGLRRFGPFLVAATLIGLQSWTIPHLFAGGLVFWRDGFTRTLSGILISLPAAGIVVSLSHKISAVHPYRGSIR